MEKDKKDVKIFKLKRDLKASESVNDQFVAHVDALTDKIKDNKEFIIKLIELRNNFFDALPVETADAWTLLRCIREYFRDFDELVEKFKAASTITRGPITLPFSGGSSDGGVP